MWGYNGNVGNRSAGSTELVITPVQDCDGPVPTITVEGVSDGDCVAGETFSVTVTWDEEVFEFDIGDIVIVNVDYVNNSWSYNEDGTEYYFEISVTSLIADVSINIFGNGVDDCVGNIGTNATFEFSVDNQEPEFTDDPTWAYDPPATCITRNNWYDEQGTWTNAPADVELIIGFDFSDAGCCSEGDIDVVVQVQQWDTQTSEWVNFGDPLSINSAGIYDAEATFTVTDATPDGEYRFRVTLTDCVDNEEEWYGLEFEVDQTEPDLTHVACTTEGSVTTCDEVTEWEAPCLSEGQSVEFCISVVEDGCGTFNTEELAELQGDNGLRLVFDQSLASGEPELLSLTGTGTSEDPYIFCFEYTAVTNDDEGEYNLTVEAADAAGNWTSLDIGHIFTLDFTDPTLDNPDDLSDCYGDGEEIDFCFDANDIGCGVESVTAVLTFANQTSLVQELTGTEGFYCFTYEITSGTTPEGEATLEITIVDEAGNETVEEFYTEFDFTAPQLVGELELPEVTCLRDGDEYCVTFTLSEDGCGIDWSTASAGATTIFSWNYDDQYNSLNETWEVEVCYTISNEESGLYDFYFSVDDEVGNTFEIYIPDAFAVDNDVPDIDDIQVEDECVTTAQSVTITFEASDAFSCCPEPGEFGVDSFFDIFVELTFENATTKRLEVTYDEGNDVFTTTYTILPGDVAGVVTVRAVAEDCAGNIGDGLDEFVIDRTAPTMFLSEVFPNDCIAPLGILEVGFLAFDIGCGDISCDNSWIILTYSNSTTEIFYLSDGEEANCSYEGQFGEPPFENFAIFTAEIEIPENAPAGPVTVGIYAQDGAGNIGSHVIVNAVTIDNTPPTIENITADESCYTDGSTVMICFDADDIGCGTFDYDNVLLEVSFDQYFWEASFFSQNGDTYCFQLYITSSQFEEGFYDATAYAEDQSGNETEVEVENLFQVIYAPINATWSVDYNEDCEYTNADPICFDFEFDREVTGFSAEDIWVSGGFAISSIEGEGDSWTVCVSSISGTGTGTLYMDVSGVYDCAGNEYYAYDISAGYDYDAPSGYSAYFSDDEGDEVDYINMFTCDDEIYITVEGGEIGAIAEWKVEEGSNVYEGNFEILQDPHTENLSLDLCDGTEGEVQLTVTLTDCAGNTGEEATDDVILDVTPPCLTIYDAPSHTNDDFEVTFNWTEDVTGFDISDIVVTNGAADDFSGSGDTYTAMMSPTTEGLVTITIGSGHGITDLAGNPFEDVDSDCNDETTTIYDTTPPEFTEILWVSPFVNEQAEVVWSEPVEGSSPVELEDLEIEFVQTPSGTATDAELIDVIHNSGDDYATLVFEITGTPNGCEYIIVRPASGSSVFDLAGNSQDGTDEITIDLVNENSATTQASNGSANSVYAVQATLNYTRGNGDKVLVVVFEEDDCIPTPINGTVYDYSETYGDGDIIECSYTSGMVVYWGTSNSVVVSGLEPSTSYCVALYEAIGGDCDSPNYLTPGHVFCFETKPEATQMVITHVNGIPYNPDADCDDWILPSGNAFSVTVGLFDDDDNPAYLTDQDDFDLYHLAYDYGFDPIVYYSWPISEQSKTFSNIQFGIDNYCRNTEASISRDAFYDDDCWALSGYFDDHDLYDEGPLHFMPAETQQQAFGITFSGVGSNQFTVSWQRSTATTSYGEGSLLVMREGLNNHVNVFPQDGETYEVPIGQSPVHFLNDSYNLGSGNRAIYYQLECICDDSHPRSVTVQGLQANTTYYARVFEFRYDVDYVNYGGYIPLGQEGQDFPQNGCEDWEERFHEQAIVTNYRHSTGTGNPRNRKTSNMEGLFAGLELIGFDGRSFERKVELAWATASEGGSLGFEVYRADAGTFEFKKIANVAGNVNGSTYKLVDDDASLEVGKSYIYRLSYIASDGTIEELDEVEVTILSMPNTIYSIFVSQLTPSPISDLGTFSVEMQGEQHLKIEVRNAAGQLVSTLSNEVRSSGVYNFTIDLKNRAAGSYNILITTENEAVYVPFVYVP